jgi:hypothetical protein
MTKHIKEKMDIVKTPIGRLSYPAVYKKAKFDGDTSEGAYQCTLLFPKGSDLSDLKKAAAAAMKSRYSGGIPKGFRSPFMDGDEPDEDGNDRGPECAGQIVVKFKNRYRQPGVVGTKVGSDGKLTPLTEESGELYPGCWARASVQPFCWEFANKKGVSFLLINIQKTGEGEPFGGTITRPDDDFNDGTVATEAADTSFDTDDWV